MKKRGIIWLVLLIIFSFWSLLQAQEPDQPRTYYESLDLSSPEAAVQTFVDAFQQEDYFTVYMILDRVAQFSFFQSIRSADYKRLFDVTYREEIFATVPLFAEGVDAMEHSPDGIFIFDDLMLAASDYDALLIDLRGEVRIIKSVPVEVIFDDESQPGNDIYAEVKGITGQLIFRTVQAPSGRWRVRQVIVPGGNETWIPWSIVVPPQ